jgi:hypothetical protein
MSLRHALCFPARSPQAPRALLSTCLACGLLAGALLVSPTAHAQPEEGEEKKPAEGAEGEKKPDEAAVDTPDMGGWGVGGSEREGKYKPRGKTGKLKELEKEHGGEEGKGGAEATALPKLPPPGFAFLDTAIGFGELVVPTQTSGATKVTPTASFLIKVGYRVDIWQIYARFPISTGESNGPREPLFAGARDPDIYKQIAPGGVELGVKPFIPVAPFHLPVGLAVSFPSAQGDLFADLDSREKVGQAIVNKAAAASRGWEDRSIFAYNRLGIIPSFGVWGKYPVGPGEIEWAPETKVEIMIKVLGNDPDPARFSADDQLPEVNTVAVSWFFDPLGMHYHFFDGLLAPGARLWFTVSNSEETQGSINTDGFQAVIEPRVKTHVSFTEDKIVGLDAYLAYMVPISGELGGDNPFDTGIGGLRIGAGLWF